MKHFVIVYLVPLVIDIIGIVFFVLVFTGKIPGPAWMKFMSIVVCIIDVVVIYETLKRIGWWL